MSLCNVFLLLCGALLCLSVNSDGVMMRMKKCGFLPANILDAGANIGKFSTETRKNLFPLSNYFMIEGNTAHDTILKETKIPFEIALIGETTKTVTYYVAKGTGTGNTIFKELGDTAMIKTERTITTIDLILSKNNFTSIQYLKLDVQGSELNALKGATKTLKNVEVIYLEAPIMHYNEGSPSFYEIMAYLEQVGFTFYSVGDKHSDGRHLPIQLDVYFVSKTSKLWDKECTGYPRPAHWLKV